MIGIAVKESIGIGDGVQFSSLPENYFRATGEKLFDVSRPWFFDHNPYVVRDGEPPEKVIQLWNYSPRQYQWPKANDERGVDVYLSNAEIWSLVLGVKPKLIRPRLYKFEDYAFEDRDYILLHTQGRSQGDMPQDALDHILNKYMPTGRLLHIGPPGSACIDGVTKVEPQSLWELAAFISKAQMFIGMDSGPSWIAACYPDIVIKKLRSRPRDARWNHWVPMERANIHSHWDDRIFQIYCPFEYDVGAFQSFRKM